MAWYFVVGGYRMVFLCDRVLVLVRTGYEVSENAELYGGISYGLLGRGDFN